MIPLITVLLVTMNRRDLLEIALWYLYETSTAEERDIWIWDNASTDDTPDFLGTMIGWPGVRVFRSKTNVGLVEPRRRMLPHVRTPYIMTLDDDVWILHKGWASAVARVLDADLSIHQLALPNGNVPSTNTYGVTHTKLDRPFFRVPSVWPQEKMQSVDPLHEYVDMYGGRTPDGVGMQVVHIGGERVIVPDGTELPVAVSGSCSAWRAYNVMSLPARADRHPVMDLREAWGFPMQQLRGSREAMMVDYGSFHPCPGPLWHIGRGESHWKTRCDMAEAVYGRSKDEQRSWLENARTASGWGQSLEDPDSLT